MSIPHTPSPNSSLAGKHPEATGAPPTLQAPLYNTSPVGTAAKPGMIPWLTYVICTICIAIFGYHSFAPTGLPYPWRIDVLAPSALSIWFGAYWGLVTSAFVHVDFWHLFFNLWWAKDLGRALEVTMGRGRSLVLVLSAAAVSSGVQLAVTAETGIGYSGVIYALCGYMLALRRIHPAYGSLMNRGTIQWLLGWLVLCIVLTLAGVWRIGNAAHIGGLLFGLGLGALQAMPERRWWGGGGVAVLIVLTVLACGYMPWSQTWRSREVIRSVFLLREKAEAGKAEAQYGYGRLLLQHTEQKAEGLEWLRKSAQQNYVEAMNSLAWVRATATRATWCNGTEALRWATEACTRNGWQEARYLDTLAAAYAELERWDEAVAMQQRAIAQLTPEQREAPSAESFAHRLLQYEKRQKVRE